MKALPIMNGKIMADLHAHIKKKHLKNIPELLVDSIIGITAITKEKDLINYQDLLNLPNIREKDTGLFAEIDSNGIKGYFVKIQEVISNHHILALGCRITLQDNEDSRRTVENIHKQRGIAILPHPLVVVSGKWPIKYRLITKDEMPKVRELIEMVDEVEVFNSQNINLIPGIKRVSMKRANDMAKELVADHNLRNGRKKKGIAGSDAHSFDQVKICGISIPEDTTSIEALKHCIKTGNFEKHEQYISRTSFLKGHFLD